MAALELYQNGKLIYHSNQIRIRPIFEVVKKFYGKISNCILHDKIVGLAVARLIVYSEFIIEVKAGVMSKPAKELLNSAGIKNSENTLVPIILNNETTGPCPMEIKANKAKNNEEFFNSLKEIFY